MPTLHWTGKEHVVNHHHQVPYRTLRPVYGFDAEAGRTDDPVRSGNRIIHGDNLEALKALLPEYEGRIKCIYIDPPYNTGNEGWVYNDNVTDPKIERWLGEVVGKEGEDLSRHDKWLCMMYPRLQLLRQLLAEDGVFVVHIDEHELNTLTLVVEEIFGRKNNLGTIIWDKKNPKGDSKKKISYQHESLVVFSKDARLVKGKIKRKKKNAKKILGFARKVFSKIGKETYPEDILQVVKKYKLDLKLFEGEKRVYDLETANWELWEWMKTQNFSGGEKAYRYLDEDGEVYRPVSMAWPNKKKAPDEYFEPLIHPTSGLPCPIPMRGWRNPPTTMKKLKDDGLILFGEDETTQPTRKYTLRENMFENIGSVYGFGGSDDKFQKQIGIKLENPKPNQFSTEILDWFTDKDSIILDSFAGSGTTAHAVLNLNRADGGNRKFILIEMEDYADSITAERVRRVMRGYGKDNKAVPGTGGSFDYYELGPALFDVEGQLNPAATLDDVRRYVWFTETRLPYPIAPTVHPDHLGDAHHVAYYLRYDPAAETVLDRTFLESITAPADHFVIYADRTTLAPERLRELHLTFKKLPRDLTRL